MAEQKNTGDRSGISERGRRRVTTVVLLSIVVLLLLLSLVAQGGFNLSPLISPNTASATLLLYALSTLNFLAFTTLFFVLLRNVFKLVRERRAKTLGSKFKARLVGYWIGLSLLPVVFLFFFAFGLLNRTIDRWFGEPTRQIVEDSHILEESYFKREESELTSLAQAVARSLALDRRADLDNLQYQAELRREMDEYDLALVRIVNGANRITLRRGNTPVQPAIEDKLLEAERQLASGGATIPGKPEGGESSIIYAIAAVRTGASASSPMLIVAREFPRAANIDEHYSKIENLRRRLKPLKDIYILVLALVTLLLVFATVWAALYVSRGITVPIQALAEATERVARGDFAHRVDVVAEDELAALVNSFNDMAGQLAENRQQLERAAEDLRRTNLELYDRQRYIETVLESLSTGVISVDDKARINTINQAALRMLNLPERPGAGSSLAGAAGERPAEDIQALCRRAKRAGKAHADLEYPRPDGSVLHAATTAIALYKTGGAVSGWVLVVEDLTDLVQAERAAAWGEVARRMAHEIKNPLTPIQLSAERIIRNYNRSGAPSTGGRLDQVIRDGTSTIIREVGTLQRMVEEFSRFARLPEAKPVDADLNRVIEDAIKLYADRLDGIEISSHLDPAIPVMKLDPEQIKRVLVNLVDNSVEALLSEGAGGPMNGNGSGSDPEPRVSIESRYLAESDAVRITVSDTGHGIKAKDRDKLFLPKFSTRDRGTGLGLAIVSHIVADHKGRIWVENNQPKGARFLIELPLSWSA